MQNLQGAVTGAIGNVRIGGNATNFSTIVNDATGSGNARIANFSIGGETDNVLLLAPNGSRNISFGLGMDKVDILTNVINNLQANRGALNSRVLVDRTISKVTIGGDVVNTNVETGFSRTSPTSSRPSPVRPVRQQRPWRPRLPPDPINAQVGGGMTVLVAGDVTNSVFTASVQPLTQTTPGASGSPSTTTRIFGTPRTSPCRPDTSSRKSKGRSTTPPHQHSHPPRPPPTPTRPSTRRTCTSNKARHPPERARAALSPAGQAGPRARLPHLGQMLMSSTISAATVHGASVPKGPSNTSTSKHPK